MKLGNIDISNLFVGEKPVINIYVDNVHIYTAGDIPVMTSSSTFSIVEDNTAIGTVTATDPNSLDLTFTIGSGRDSSLFSIGETTGVLTFIAAPDYDKPLDIDENNEYEVYVKITNSDGKFIRPLLKVTVDNSNVTPNTITIDVDSVSEDATIETLIGTFTTTLDGEIISYELVEGRGGEDNTSFIIIGDGLYTNSLLNYEVKSNYSILVEASNGEDTVRKIFSITVVNVLESPSDIILSQNYIHEGNEINDIVAVLDTINVEQSSNIPEYALVEGTGDTDNSSFSILDNKLIAKEVFDYETKDTYSIRLSATTDAGTKEKAFTINILNVNEEPVFTSPSVFNVTENTTIVGTVVAADPELQVLTYSIVGGLDRLKFSINSASGVLSFITAPDYEFPTDSDGNNVYEVIVRATDTDVLYTNQTINVTVTNVSEGDWYVDYVNGNDLSNGSEQFPFKTVAKALSVAYAGSTIYLRDGEHKITSQLVPPRSGTSSAKIKIAKYPGESPVISSFITLSGWQAEGVGTHIYSVPVASQSMPNIVLVNGINTSIGRYPASGWDTITSSTNSPATTITSSKLADRNWIGAEVVVRKAHWVIDRGTITAHSGSQITFTGTSAETVKNGFGFFIQNHQDCLLYTGAWYYKNGRLYMYFANDNPNSYTVKTSLIDTTINVSNQSYIEFADISIQGGNKRNLYISNSSNIVVNGGNISNGGGLGVQIVNSSNNCRIENNVLLEKLNNGGIKSDPGCDYISILDNELNNIGLIAGMGENGNNSYQGIMTEGDNDIIEGNTLNNIGYIGIHSRGDNFVIDKNHVDGVCTVKDDGAGIYTYGPSTNRSISQNTVLNAVGAGDGTADGIDAANGIYCDDTTTNVLIDGNYVDGCSHFGVYIHNSHEITITNNNVYNNGTQFGFVHDTNYPLEAIRNIVFDNNTLVSVGLSQEPFYYSGLDNDIDSVFSSANENAIINVQRGQEAIRINCYNSTTFKEYWDGIHIDRITTLGKELEVAIPNYTINSLGAVNKFANGTFDTVADNVSAGYYPNGTLAVSWDNTNKINAGTCRIDVTSESVGVSNSNRAYNRALGESGLNKTEVGDTYVIDSSKKYILSFDVLGTTANRTIGFYIRLNAAPWTKLTPEIYLKSTDTIIHHEFLIEPTGNGATAALSFFFNDEDSPIYLDNISLKETSVTKWTANDYILASYNNTNDVMSIVLTEDYEDVNGTVYSGSFVLAANTSKILFKIERLTFTSSAAFTVDEHQTAIGTVEAGEGASYLLVGGTDQSKFAIDANTGILSFLVAPNYEIPTDANTDNDYQVTVRASKNGFTNDQEITVTVQNVTTDNVVIPLISTGTGVGVVELKLYVSSNTTMTIGGNGKFYDDAGGTLNEGTSRNVNAGDERVFYVKVTSGTCNITIVDGQTVLTQIRGWSQVTNGPSINGMTLSSLPTGLTRLSVTGNNTITGTLAQLPTSLSYMLVRGSNTISGSISDMPSTLTFVWVEGDNTISDYTNGRNWNDSMERLLVIPASGGLSASEIDNLFIDMDNTVASWVSPKVIYLTGANAAPTATSLTARNSLISKGVTITTN